MLDYGVLRGPVVDFGREDGNSSPHFQIVILASGNRFRVPFNVRSGVGSGTAAQVLFSVVDPLVNHSLISKFLQIPEGFTQRGNTEFFLDYLRAPMLDITTMRALPHAQAGP